MTTSNARSFQVPAEQFEPVNGPVTILWDIENCQVPSDVRPEDVAGNIRLTLRSHPVIKGAVTIFSAYGDFSIFSRKLREGCQRTGIKLVDVPNGRKDAADMAILVDMFLFALDNPPPSTIMLISGDVDFASALHVLGQRGYTIILVVPSGRTVSPALSNAGRFIWDWSSVVHGQGYMSSIALTASAIDSGRGTLTLQDKRATASHNKGEQAGFGNCKLPMVDISDLPSSSSKYGQTTITSSSVPISRFHNSLMSSVGTLGKGIKHEDLIIKDQAPEAQGIKGLLPRSLPPAGVKPEYHKIIQWLLHAVSFGACKFANLIMLMKSVASTLEKGNLLLRAHFDKPDKEDTNMGRGEMKDKEVISDSVSLLDTARCLDNKMAVRCSSGTDLLASGNLHVSDRINNMAHYCANVSTRQMPKEIKKTHLTRCESRKRDCNGEEVVEKQNQGKKIKKSDEMRNINDSHTASGLVVDEMSNTGTEKEIGEIRHQTCSEFQPGEGSKTEMEANNVQSEKHSIFKNVYDSKEVCNLPKFGNECQNRDKLQGSSNGASSVGPIISSNASVPKNLTTTKEMPSIELKTDVFLESELGGNLENIEWAKTANVQSAWCEICIVDCKSKVVLEQHKHGKKHRNKLLKLHEANGGSNATGFIELKTDNLIGSKEVLMKETRSAGSFVFEAEADTETKTPTSNNTVQSAWCGVCEVVMNSEEVLGSYKLSNEKESFEKNLKNPKGDPAVAATSAICNMKGGKKTSMEVLSSNIFSVTKVGQKDTPERSTWCDVCGVNCFNEMVLNNHKQGSKHKKRLERLQKKNNVFSAADPSPSKPINETNVYVPKKNSRG